MLKAQVESLEKANLEKEATIDNLKIKLTEAESQFSETLKPLNETLSAERQKAFETKERLEDVEFKLRAANDKITELRSFAVELEEEKDCTEGQLAEAEEAIMKLENQLASGYETLQQVLDENSKSSLGLQEAESRIHDLKKTLSEETSKFEAYMQAFVEEKVSLESKLSTLNQEMTR